MASKNQLVKALKVLKDTFSGELGSDGLNKAFNTIDSAISDGSWDSKGSEQNGRHLNMDGGGESFPLPKEITKKGEFALFSDGACRGNPGPGAWGVMGQDYQGKVLFYCSGIDTRTTNNRMELQGAIEAIKQIELLEDKGEVWLYSDSKYVVDGMNSWVSGWKKRGWKKADKKIPENIELWKELDEVSARYGKVHFKWVKGHAGHPQNECCDSLANEALDDAGL